MTMTLTICLILFALAIGVEFGRWGWSDDNS